MSMSTANRRFRVFLIVCNAFLFVATLGVNAYGSFSGLFGNNTAFNTNRYDLDVTPASWTFGVMWSTIYMFQAALIVYSIVNIWRATPSGYLYYSPDIMPQCFLIAYMANWVCNSTWILLAMRAMFDRTFLPMMTAVLWLLCVTLAVALVFSYRALAKERPLLQKYGLSGDICGVIVVVQNGISIYATWSAIASSLNVGLALAYVGDVSEALAGTAVLTLVATLLTIYVCLDVFVLDRFTRFIFAPHCTVILATSGIVSKLGVTSDPNSVFAVVLLAFTAALLIAKIVVSVVRSAHDKRSVEPRYSDRVSITKTPLP